MGSKTKSVESSAADRPDHTVSSLLLQQSPTEDYIVDLVGRAISQHHRYLHDLRIFFLFFSFSRASWR